MRSSSNSLPVDTPRVGAKPRWSMSFLKLMLGPSSINISKDDEFARSRARNTPYLLVAIFLALLHLGSAWLGYVLIPRGSRLTPEFPGAGLDLVVVLVFGPRYWPILALCYFATAMSRNTSWTLSAVLALASLVRTLASAWLFQEVRRIRKILGDFSDLAGIVVSGVIAPGLGAALGTACLVYGGRFPMSAWQAVLSSWWIAEALGIFTVAPVLIGLARSWADSRPDNLHIAKLLMYTSGVSAVAYLILFREEPRGLLFTPFVLILIAGGWLGPSAARLTALIVASVAIWATRVNVGPFAGATFRENLQNLELFLVAISLTGVAVGAFRLRGNLLVPAAVLLSGWALSGWLYASLDHDRTSYDQSRFERIVSVVESEISGSFRTYEQVLWSAAGHLAISERMSPKDWHAYVERLHLLDLYPGVTAVSIVQPVLHHELPSFVQTRQHAGWPTFIPHEIPTGAPKTAPEHFLVVCAEPPKVAAGAIGADLISDPFRKAAAERARDFGAATMTATTAFGDGSGKGMQLFVPVYREGAPLKTTEDRRSALIAWVSIVFNADTFLRSTFGATSHILGLTVYEGEPTGTGDLLFSSMDAVRSARPTERITHLTIAGRTWSLGWRRLPNFPYQSRTPAALTAGCTALLSLLLAGLVTTLQTRGREAANHLKVIQSALTLGTWDLDAKCGIVQCSEQLLHLYGLPGSRESFLIDEWLGHVHPEDRGAMIAEFSARRTNREVIDRQYRVVWPDGSIHWLHRKALVMSNDHGDPVVLVGVDFDVSEIKELQSQLAQAQKLESVGQLAAGIAHEINTPIQYVGDNAKFLEDAFRELVMFADRDRESAGSSGEMRLGDTSSIEESELEYLKSEVPRALIQMTEGIDQVARIVRAMKEFSHPGPVEKALIDLNRAIESTVLVSRNEWKYVSDLTTDLDPDLAPVPGVAGEINQVILNLIVNAAHAISDVVKDTGSKGAIQISSRQKNESVEIRISDTGGGIPQTIQSKVFDPFFTTKPLGKGTGQGLAIAHAVIVQKHGGALRFESTPGSGTTFIIELPLAQEMESV